MTTRTALLRLSLLVCFAVTSCNQNAEKSANINNLETIAVTTHPISTLSIENSLDVTGVLQTENEALCSFKIGGIIDRIYVQEGSVFSKGQLLASLKLTEIEAGEEQARLGLDKAKRDFQRIKNLFADSVATLEQLQDIQTALEIAEKQLASIAFNKEYALIYANNNGFVRKKMANEGEVVGSGMPVLAISENVDNEWLFKTGVSDKDWVKVAVGNNAIIVFDAFPDMKFKGVVYRKSMAVDPGTGSFQIEIKVNCEGVKPAVGMFGKASITTHTNIDYIAIPHEAVVEADGKNAFVFVPMSDQRVKKQPVVIHSFDSKEVKVQSGLDGVTAVVLANSAFLNERSIINIVN